MKIAFIGLGNMGEAILAAVLSHDVATAAEISGSDIKSERRDYIAEKYGIKVGADAPEAVAGADLIFLGCKPQDLASATGEFADNLKPGQVVVSILAGTTLKALTANLKHNSVVRVMPNTPAQVGQGMSAWTATSEITPEQQAAVGEVLRAMGQEVYVDDETSIDMATAVSGSGPAYVFLFVEALEAAAARLGFPEATARQLAQQTLLGSALYLDQSGLPPAELRCRVTSPGGTTAAALARFEEGGFTELVYQAALAAFKRARELDA